jgi:hypothetical protein
MSFLMIAYLHLLSMEISPWSLIDSISITFFFFPPTDTLLDDLLALMLLSAFYTASFLTGFSKDPLFSSDSALFPDEP